MLVSTRRQNKATPSRQRCCAKRRARDDDALAHPTHLRWLADPSVSVAAAVGADGAEKPVGVLANVDVREPNTTPPNRLHGAPAVVVTNQGTETPPPALADGSPKNAAAGSVLGRRRRGSVVFRFPTTTPKSRPTAQPRTPHAARRDPPRALRRTYRLTGSINPSLGSAHRQQQALGWPIAHRQQQQQQQPKLASRKQAAAAQAGEGSEAKGRSSRKQQREGCPRRRRLRWA